MSEQPVALVTGGAKGIGFAIARRLARDGFDVAIADSNFDLAVAAAERLSQEIGVRALHVLADVSNPESANQMVAQTVERFGRLDALVNNAGIAGKAAPVAEYPTEEWRRIMAVNLDGVFYCCRAAVAPMVSRGYGRIVNIASISGKEGNPNMAAYSTSKAGVIGLTKALGKELATTGVLVNCVAPAVIHTEILDQLTEEAVNYMVSKIPMGRVGQPEEVAALVSWLCSKDCSFSTGAVYDISGGRATY